MNNAIVINSAVVAQAVMPVAYAARSRRFHFWDVTGATPATAAHAQAGRLSFANELPASDSIRAHRTAIPVRHRQHS